MMKVILSLDNGGIRSIISALVLKDLARRLNRAGCHEPLHHYVDLFAGTGIAAVMAAGLCFAKAYDPEASESTPDEVLEMLRFHHDFVFDQTPKVTAGAGPYSAGVFEDNLKQRFGESTTLAAARTGILIPAYDMMNRRAVVFSNLENGSSNFYLWQALRGTCALPEFFAPAMVENLAKSRPRGTPLLPFFTGGAMATDPTLCAYAEASRVRWTRPGSQVVVISLGAGLDRRPLPYFDAANAGYHGQDLASVTPHLVNVAHQLECPAAQMLNSLINRDMASFDGIATRLTNQNRGLLNYYRINGALSAGSVAMDDLSPGNIAGLVEDGERIIAENGAVLDELVWRIAESQPVRSAERQAAAKVPA